MEKIGILTYHRAYSYGAKLQAYALATYLTSIGFEAEVIDYGNIGEEKLRKIGTKSLKDFIVTTLCYIASSIAEPQRIRHFDEFMDIIPHSPKHYDKANIAEANDKYDYFITGSDQVWNPKYNEGDLTYLLDFVKDNKKIFSYAASFGVSQLPDDILQVYKPLLKRFNKNSYPRSYWKNFVAYTIRIGFTSSTRSHIFAFPQPVGEDGKLSVIKTTEIYTEFSDYK